MVNESPILFLEINEISWKMLNHYLGKKRYKYLEEFFKNSEHYTTITVDEGELSPWVVWPSIHRGMPNTEHRVFHLGQDPNTFKGTTIWEEYLKAGKNIGIFGSMQSWPPKNPGQNGFYITDTFAHDSSCYPSYLEPIINFNLKLVSQNNREVNSKSLFAAINFQLLLALLKSGLRVKTYLALLQQVVGEIFDSRLKERRRIYQNIIFWDIFRALYNPKNPPAFSTYFTNHIAGAMHRFWNTVFPEDFPAELQPSDLYHQKTMDFAFQSLDILLKDVLQWKKINPNLTIIFATGMGQDKVIRDEHHGYELVVTNIASLMKCVGLRADEYKALLAMAPQTAVAIENDLRRKQSKETIQQLKMHSGNPLFQVNEEGQSLSLTILYSDKNDCKRGAFLLPNGKECKFTDAGITLWETEAGTGYHIPEGILAVTGPGTKEFSKDIENKKIFADKIKKKLMKIGGISTG